MIHFHPLILIHNFSGSIDATNMADKTFGAKSLSLQKPTTGKLHGMQASAYFAYWRAERSFDVVTTKPHRVLPWFVVGTIAADGAARSAGVQFCTLNRILQDRPEQDIASCRMFDLPSKPPSTPYSLPRLLLPTLSSYHYHRSFPFAIPHPSSFRAACLANVPML